MISARVERKNQIGIQPKSAAKGIFLQNVLNLFCLAVHNKNSYNLLMNNLLFQKVKATRNDCKSFDRCLK
jgi:hypothetical protein